MDRSETNEAREITAFLEQLAQFLRGGRVLLIGEETGDGPALLEKLQQDYAGTNATLEITVHDRFLPGGDPADSVASHYEYGSFDLVVCNHIAARNDLHQESLAALYRITRPGGLLLIIDRLVPGTRLRGKKARQTREAGQYINSWTRLWHPGHQRYLDLDTWQHYLLATRWQPLSLATRQVVIDFDSWCALQPLSDANRIRLRAMLLQAPEKVSGFLTPESAGDRMSFHLTEGFILATKLSGTL